MEKRQPISKQSNRYIQCFYSTFGEKAKPEDRGLEGVCYFRWGDEGALGEMTFEQRLEGSESVNHTGMWEARGPGVTARARALR